MIKPEHKLGMAMSTSVVVLLILMCFKNEINFLSKDDRIFISAGIGDGVFFSMGDFLTYNVFVISGVLTVLWIYSNIIERLKNKPNNG
ncbi:hypothetical protein ACMGDK_11715 [Chryseobacterium sp. DT-3]|uniref:hypothetical protein n=1 Tax=Chryseobacterium sp. DT-3 TaxID=3396164 RepID=UPI003F19D396